MHTLNFIKFCISLFIVWIVTTIFNAIFSWDFLFLILAIIIILLVAIIYASLKPLPPYLRSDTPPSDNEKSSKRKRKNVTKTKNYKK